MTISVPPTGPNATIPSSRIGSLLRSVAILAVALITLVGSRSIAQVGSGFGKNKVEYKSFDWHFIQSPHFDIYFYQGGRELAEFCADHAEQALDSIERVMHYDITNRISILVYNSHNDFQQTNAVGEYLPEGVGGVTELLKNRVVLPFEGDFELFRHVIHHELTHAVVNDMFVGGTYQSLLTGGGMEIPSWMNEGLSEYTSLHGLDLATDMYMRDATLNEAVPQLDRLGGYVQYRVGQTMYWYIEQKYGPEKVGELLQRIRTTRSVEQGFRSTFGLSVVEFGEKFIEGLKVLYFPDIARFEDPNDYAEAIADHKKLKNFMNVSPELSPQGDLVAFISDRSDYYDVYVQSVGRPGSIRKILSGGGASANFEELHLLTPGLTWSPDAKRLALASKAGERDAIFLLDVNGGAQERLPNIDLDAIQGVKWSPDGRMLALIGILNGQSDLYVYDLETNTLTDVTGDVAADHEPSWTADSKGILYVSQQAQARRDSALNGASLKDRAIYRYDLARHSNSLVLAMPNASVYYPMQSSDGTLFFISDANGINNIYTAKADGTGIRPVTNSVSKIDQISISADGAKLAFSTMHKLGYDLYLLRNPATTAKLAALPVTDFRKNDGGRLVAKLDTLRLGARPGAASDTTKGYGDVGVDLHDYVYSNTPEPPKRSGAPGREQRTPATVVTGYRDSTGHYAVHPYRTVFTPDVIIGSAGYAGYYGLQGTTQMLFSDELGDQQLFFATNLILDLKNSDYLIAYYNLKDRTDWGFQGYHSAAFFQETTDPAVPDLLYPVARFTSSGLAGILSYPYSRFSRMDLTLTAAIFQKDLIVNENVPTQSAYAIFPQLNYVHDDALNSYFYPIDGTRYNIGLSASPKLGPEWLGFVTPSVDLRHYVKLGSTMSIATRLVGAASFGPTPQHFFIGGVDGWINRTYKDLGFPINSPADFAFFTPGLPLRGYAYDEKIGTRYAIANLEVRYPFPISVAGIPFSFFGDSFIDAGTAWNKQVYLFERTPDGTAWQTRDLLLSAGTGIRTYLFGFYVHMDIAWTTNLIGWGRPDYLFSLGQDF